MQTETVLAYRVEKRYRKPPPAPYENPWRLEFSFHLPDDALECATEEADSFCEHRVLGKCTDPNSFYAGRAIQIVESVMIGATRLFKVVLADQPSVSFHLPREFTA